MKNPKEYIEARKEFISLVKKELLGPGSEVSIPDEEHELISNTPDVRYSIGILFPQNNKLNADNDDSIKKEETIDENVGDIEENDFSEDDEIGNSKEKGSPVDSNDDDNLDEEIGLASQNMPSSMGITFFAKGNSEHINCRVSFGTYRHAKDADCKVPFYPRESEDYEVPPEVSSFVRYDKEDGCLKFKGHAFKKYDLRELWKNEILNADGNNILNYMSKLCDQMRGFVRIPHSADVKLDFSYDDYIDANKNLDNCNVKVTALRRKVSDNLYSITIMLVNSCMEKSNGTRCIFQPEIRIDSQNNEFVFSEYSGDANFSLLDDEEQSLNLLYRNKKVYGTGLGTSLSWNIDSDGRGELYNDFFPEIEVPQMDFQLPEKYQIDKRTLSMKYLSDLNDYTKEEKIDLLRKFIESYKKWIDDLSEKLKAIDEKFQHIGNLNLSKCRESYERMKNGIESLQKDDVQWNAFELANRAMFMQRVHLELQKETSNIDRYPDDEVLAEKLEKIDYAEDGEFTKDQYFWRPFQLAFLLMSVNSITDDKSKDRNVVDLIWFPTGGGKTEAYLGLTAFTIFYRRMAHCDVSGGTSVIMRYTLRLLAAQQFTRASTLICACEYIRKDSQAKRPKYKAYVLGKEEISIGLWIGSVHTPNKNDKAKECLTELRSATIRDLREKKEKNNKFQILKCPWCGTKLVKDIVDGVVRGEFGYRMEKNRHFQLYCPQESCHFNQMGKLPLQIVDEELYRQPPTLLFGTVDKFAMLPWKREIGSFFALNTGDRSPELIIQDELHLISGPLGSMVGLYETAIDALCESKGVKTKIIASTATIRRAQEQCSALYNRDVLQFPHPGLDSEDSFFARESDVNYGLNKYGRMYVGLMPSGKTKAMMEVRSIAALLQKIHIMQLPDEVKDKYWTLTTYFNSLKDLGKCSTLVDDDVKDFIKRSAYRLGVGKDARLVTRADELTSRVSTTELNETLDKLEKLEYSKENIAQKRYASNILLATNMISVGIDVARLNVMLLVGQPKLTSEYIQASSRVGRSFPGVAFTMYDGAKSRDRSHYEQFKSYHESFYKYVEPTGVTPFSEPACDRALKAVVVSLLRHLEDELRPEEGAGHFSRKKYIDIIEKIKTFILNRETSIVNRLKSGMVDDCNRIEMAIEQAVDDWDSYAKTYSSESFVYGERFLVKPPANGEHRLLKAFNSDSYDNSAFNTMTSMRNVDSSVAGNVVVWENKK